METGSAVILEAGMLTSVGLSALQTASSVRAGIARFAESEFFAKNGEPQVMSLVPDEYLASVDEWLDAGVAWDARSMRLLMLAVPALQEATAGRAEREAIPLFLGLPEASASHGAALITSLAQAARVNLDLAASEAICAGRAAGLFALEQALEFLARGAGKVALVGGVDSFFDQDVLATLDAEDRLQGEGVMDGFIPGEGAGFLLLSATGAPAHARVTALGLGSESGHRYSDEPYRGEGLAQAIGALFSRAGSASAPVRTVYAGYNGENFWAKEWGVAYLRNREYFAEAFRFEHPADCFGDIGAALGPVMIGLAAAAIVRGYHPAPCLVWCSSDREARGAALVTTNTP